MVFFMIILLLDGHFIVRLFYGKSHHEFINTAFCKCEAKAIDNPALSSDDRLSSNDEEEDEVSY